MLLSKSSYLALLISAALLAGFYLSANPAQAKIITPEEHWKYGVHWYWDSTERATVGMIIPTIVIVNDTFDRIDGYIADANGSRLDMYDGEQVVKARYCYDSGLRSDWELAAWIHDGYFSIQIPEKYRDSDNVSLYIGNNDYLVDPGDINLARPHVYINSIRMDHERHSTAISVADAPQVELKHISEKIPIPGSLIDMILARFNLL